MLKLYAPANGSLKATDVTVESARRAAWIDLLEPTEAEERIVEEALGIDVPTVAEMAEIEMSSRLFRENDSLYMTATLLTGSATSNPQGSPVTFILTPAALVTVRYSAPTAFTEFATRAERTDCGQSDSATALAGLLDAIVNRMADVLEHIAKEIDTLSLSVFAAGPEKMKHGRDYQALLRQVGHNGDLASKVRESLVSLSRLVGFAVAAEAPTMSKSVRAQLKTIARDLASLADHDDFLSSKIAFLLDAVLGLINIEQNAIIKIFSVAAVVFLPPTLIASIYGMNFDHMPELHWLVGYPLALVLMVISAILPYFYFKRRGWL